MDLKEYVHLYLSPDGSVRDAVTSGPESIIGSWSDKGTDGLIHVFISEIAKGNMVHKLYSQNERNEMLARPSGQANKDTLVVQALMKGDREKAKELGLTEAEIDKWLLRVEQLRSKS